MPGARILVVDDTPVNLKLTRTLLEYEGYEVHTAASAEEALGLLADVHPRLVLADIQLPGIDGLEMTRRIKADPRTAGTLVIALTAYAVKGAEEKARAAGCDGYITKPIDTRTLGARLRAYLEGQPAPPAPAETVPAPVEPFLPESEMRELRERFLREGFRALRQWEEDLGGAFDTAGAASLAHQWVGAGSLLGFPRISLLAREAETLLREVPLDAGQFRDLIESLVREFSAPTTTEAGEPTRHPLAAPGATVLIASGDTGMAALLHAILQSQGIGTHTVSDGAAALDAIRDTRPGVAMLDSDLPGMSGFDVLHRIRAEELPVKVLFLGGDPAADASLPKPYDPIELVVKLRKLLVGSNY